MERGWVKNYRKIEDWEWYKKPLTAHLFQHLIRRANHTVKKWQGYEIPAGCLVTSIPHLAEQTGLSIQQVKTSLSHLYSSLDIEKVTDIITDGKKANFTVLKVNHYSVYQEDNRPVNRPLTDEQPTVNRPVTTNKNERIKELKNERNIKTMSGDKPPDTPAAEVIWYLNEKADKKFSPNSDASCKPINARIREGASIEDLKRVIDLKVSEWKDNETMNKYLRPQTLFGPQKFEQYMNEVPAKREKTKEEMQAEYGGTWL